MSGMPPTPPSEPRAPLSAAGEPHGLLVVTVDRLPAWMLSPWGGTWVATPTFDGLAARGVLFDRLLVPRADPQVVARDLLTQATGRSIFAAATARGWSAAVITDQPAVTAAVDLGAPVDATTLPAVAMGAVAVDVPRTNAARVVDAAARVVAAGRHRAIWCHVGSLGIAWDAPDDVRGMYVDPDDPPPPAGSAVPDMRIDGTTDPDLIVGLRHVFASQVTVLDRCLGDLLDAAAHAAPPDHGWIVVVAGLRGLPLGLHGWMGGRADRVDERAPFSETAHVPAIIVDPRGRMAAQRYGGLVIPADIGATIGDLVRGLPAADAPGRPWEGRSMAGLFEQWRHEPRDRVVIRGPAGNALVTPGWHLVDMPGESGDRRDLLFAKPDDFFECTDVADRRPEVAEELARVLAAGGGADPDAAWSEPLSAAAVSPEA